VRATGRAPPARSAPRAMADPLTGGTSPVTLPSRMADQGATPGAESLLEWLAGAGWLLLVGALVVGVLVLLTVWWRRDPPR
jgi:hypothetical protein